MAVWVENEYKKDLTSSRWMTGIRRVQSLGEQANRIFRVRMCLSRPLAPRWVVLISDIPISLLYAFMTMIKDENGDDQWALCSSECQVLGKTERMRWITRERDPAIQCLSVSDLDITYTYLQGQFMYFILCHGQIVGHHFVPSHQDKCHLGHLHGPTPGHTRTRDCLKGIRCALEHWKSEYFI